MLKTIICAPLSFIYGLVVDIRHKLFDLKILKSEEFDIPIICVGNITVGGTGKTPFTEYLIEKLSKDYNVAVVSRGYKRKSKGFILSTVKSSFRDIGDEPKQIKLKYPDIPVAVCEKRAEGIHRLRELHPEVNLIILDDAFQHRYVEPWINIVLMDYNRPIYKDKMLPLGRLRDRIGQMSRANFIVTTKCPLNMTPLDSRIIKNSLALYPYQSLYFTRMKPGRITPLFGDVASADVKVGSNIIVMAGIANPSSFISSLNKRYKVVSKLIFDDHHLYRMKDMNALLSQLKNAPEGTIIVTTEKDAVKLTNRKKIDPQIQRKLYYIPIHVSFFEDGERDFIHKIEQYVRTNQKYSLLHPQ